MRAYAALVSAAKVMRCTQCSLVIIVIITGNMMHLDRITLRPFACVVRFDGEVFQDCRSTVQSRAVHKYKGKNLFVHLLT